MSAGETVEVPGAAVAVPAEPPTKSIKEIADSAVPGARVDEGVEAKRLEIGGWVVLGLLGLILLVLVGIGVYASQTQPTIDETKTLLGTTGADLSAAYEKRHTAWFNEIKDLLQLLVIALLIPLLATLIGYLFGRQEQAASSNE